MKWKIEFWEPLEDEDEYILHEYTSWASSFFEAFGFFSSRVMNGSCRKCVVTAYCLDKPCGDSPVLVYDNY